MTTGSGANRENQQREPRAGFSQMNPRRRVEREENAEADDLIERGVFAKEAESHRQADDEPVARFAVRLRRAPAGDHRPRPAEDQRRINRHQNCADAEQRRGGGDEQQPERRARADFAREKTQQHQARDRGEERREKPDAEFRVAKNRGAGELNERDGRRLAVIRQRGMLGPDPLIRLVLAQFDGAAGEINPAPDEHGENQNRSRGEAIQVRSSECGVRSWKF